MEELKAALEGMKEYLSEWKGPCVSEYWVYKVDPLIEHYKPKHTGFSWLTPVKSWRKKVEQNSYVKGFDAVKVLQVTEDLVKEIEAYIAKYDCPAAKWPFPSDTKHENKPHRDGGFVTQDNKSIRVAVSLDFSEAELQIAAMLTQLTQVETLEKKVKELEVKLDQEKGKNHSLTISVRELLHQVENLREGNKILEDCLTRKGKEADKLVEDCEAWKKAAQARLVYMRHSAEKHKELKAEIEAIKSRKPKHNSFVLAYGNLRDGYNLVGPFATSQDAAEYRLRDDPTTEILQVSVPAKD